MLNLLKFRAQAAYKADSGHAPCSGVEAYKRYQQVFTVAVGATSQAQVLYDGPVDRIVIGVPGSDTAEWDNVLVVRYPSKAHFLAMMANEQYRSEGLPHRYAGLERTVLLKCRGYARPARW